MAVAKKISEFGVCAFPLAVSDGFRVISVRPAHREGRLRSTSELAYNVLQGQQSLSRLTVKAQVNMGLIPGM